MSTWKSLNPSFAGVCSTYRYITSEGAVSIFSRKVSCTVCKRFLHFWRQRNLHSPRYIGVLFEHWCIFITLYMAPTSHNVTHQYYKFCLKLVGVTPFEPRNRWWKSSRPWPSPLHVGHCNAYNIFSERREKAWDLTSYGIVVNFCGMNPWHPMPTFQRPSWWRAEMSLGHGLHSQYRKQFSERRAYVESHDG